jgi:heat shock protein HslJ
MYDGQMLKQALLPLLPLLLCGHALAQSVQPIMIRVRGVELHYIEQVQGEPLILLHGGRGDYRYSSSTSDDLSGTSWRLVKFQDTEGTMLVPASDRSKYTIAFGANGRATVRVDCNRGSGGWKYKGPNQIQFGSMSVTRAKCGPGSLHDRIVKDGAVVRNYVIKDGHLFLSLLEDAGTYELEPLARSRSPVRKR